MFEVVTGEGQTFGPFTARAMREFVERLPSWICWEARMARYVNGKFRSRTMNRMSESANQENMLSALRAASRSDRLGGAIADAAAYLSTVADQLDRWAEESRNGGWSTHQVQANISLADSCRRMAAQLRAKIA